METELLSADIAGIEKAAELIKKGELVGMPTETVYGLAADACNQQAVAKIFAAKGRPADNPLIVHIADISELQNLCDDIPELAYRLAGKFWPGPLTMILKKKSSVPDITSGGLDTVGIRMPSHPAALMLIEKSGLPLAAPSGNISGYPSPTKAEHMMRDMKGRISAVIDGGECSVGVESTVISFENDNTVRILRPGGVTRDDLLEEAENVIIDPAILHEISEGQTVRSPGMKYQHYSPKARVIMVEGGYESFCRYVNENSHEGVYAIVFEDDNKGMLRVPSVSYGCDDREQAHMIFSRLREMDSLGAEKVYVMAPKAEGVGLAVYNRLIRAAGFEVIQV
ncbi:MAG: L-threonylcarbamoyladenylate synthase [Oscillospiraceae bacterium]|nr:L-threonylcarbamoyladenylate synthase [Oscillospiraceae bacterium]